MKSIHGILELHSNRLVIRLPQPRFVRVMTRSLVLVLTVLSLPLLNAALAHANVQSRPRNGQFLPGLLGDLSSRGLHRPGSRAVFLGDAGAELQLLVQSGIHPVSEQATGIADTTVDFLLTDKLTKPNFYLIDRVLKVGGVAAVRLGSDPAELFNVPASYRMIYARRFGSMLAVALKKTKISEHHVATDNEIGSGQMWARRKLLAVPDAKKEALNGLEEVALEPPMKGRRRRRTMYLPDLMKDSLDGYPRRVFVDVGAPGRTGSSGWFERHYPRRHRDFEIIRVDVVTEAAAGDGGMTEWLGRNVREEEYVVVKAEAEVVEEMVKGRAIGLVDELFLECSNQWEKGKNGVKSRRAYWECLALYGKLRDEGVAVHQWWG